MYGRNGGEWRTSMNNPSKGGVFTSGGRSVLTGPSGKKKFNKLNLKEKLVKFKNSKTLIEFMEK